MFYPLGRSLSADISGGQRIPPLDNSGVDEFLCILTLCYPIVADILITHL